MMVYRVINEYEYKLYIKSEGKIFLPCGNLRFKNSFEYKKNTSYMHFFKDKNMLPIFLDLLYKEYIKENGDIEIEKFKNKFYYFFIDIPDYLLEKYKGKGKYIIDDLTYEIDEYCIPLSLIKMYKYIEIIPYVTVGPLDVEKCKQKVLINNKK